MIDFFISKLAPYDCLACGYEGSLVCTDCAAKHFRPIPPRCYRCRRISGDARTCQQCRRTTRLRTGRIGVVYDALAKTLVWHLKFYGAQAAAREMADHIPEVSEGIIVPVPTATSRVRRRGYDQAKLLARQVAQRNGLAYMDCLRRSGQSHQVGASRKQRLAQLQSVFRVSRPRLVIGQHVVLVDDIVTTGATLEAAATVLKEAGARAVDAVVFAQP